MSVRQEPSHPTFENDERLPRVPLPALGDTGERFVEWCAPLLSAEELAATESAVASFLRPGGPGRTLHSALERYDARTDVCSWLDRFWPDRYLGRRDRIAINANFFFLLEDSDEGQIDRAAGLVHRAVHYKLLVDEQAVPPTVQRGQALSMEQNKYLFSTTRIPGRVKDWVRAPYSEDCPGPSDARHVVVFFRGHLFRLDVIDPGGRPHPVDELAAGLRAVMAAGAAPAATGTSVGHLTTKARAQWAASREALLDGHPDNAEMLDAVETALFCLCLEDLSPESPLDAADHLLHGNSANRWFDKALSLIVFEDGTAGINGEHCMLDGTTIVSFVESILASSVEEAPSGPGTGSPRTPAWSPLTFVLDAEQQADVEAAAASFAAFAAETASAMVRIDDFTSDRAKQLGVSPDAFAQMSFQLAHRRAKGRVGSTYESISTRHYRHGRTEAMRVVTPEVVRFVAAMDDPGADEATRRAALRAAADKHGQRAKKCQAGQAPEQHLWELQLIQKRSGEELGVTEPLPLFETPGWQTMRDDYLSTSALPSGRIQYFGFGSTSTKCIGIGYSLLPDRFQLYLSTPRAVSDQMARFATELPAAVRELQELLDRDTP